VDWVKFPFVGELRTNLEKKMRAIPDCRSGESQRFRTAFTGDVGRAS